MSDTPRTDAVALDHPERVTHPDTYLTWTDYRELRELCRQLERELSAKGEGVFVPREPTMAMRRAAHAVVQENSPYVNGLIPAIYKAMLSAAPSPTPTEQKQSDVHSSCGTEHDLSEQQGAGVERNGEQ